MVCEKSVEIREICGRQLSAQCAKEQAGCFYFPTDLSDKHRCHADCLSITQIALSARQIDTETMRVALSKNTDFTDAHGWGFSRIVYSCSAAYCLVFDAPSAQRIATDFFACGECDEVGCHMTGLLDMRKIRLRSVGPKGHQSPRHRRKE